jgi:predicted transcriptional regulator
MELRINQISDIKFQKYPSLMPHNTVLRAAWLMLSGGITSIPVCIENKIVGMISYNDVAKLFLPNFYILPKNEFGDYNELFLQYPRRRVNQFMTKNVLTVNQNNTTIDVVKILSESYFVGNGIEIKNKTISSVPIVEENTKTYIGSVTYFDILNLIDVDKRLSIEPFMNKIYPTVSKFDTIQGAHFIMSIQSTRNIIVVDENNSIQKPVGILSDNQILRYFHPKFPLEDLLVEEIMTDIDILPTLIPSDPIEKVINIFRNREFGLKMLPITKNGVLVGTISYLDIFHYLIQKS